jgi:sugar/nucleoside kinase (ribokinase family)
VTPASVGCFSYLAATHTLHVDTYPKTNYGVEVQSTDRFLAGDGPLVAGMLTALGHSAVLFTNAVATDPDGQRVTDRLTAWNIDHRPSPIPARRTRVNTVVADRAGSRTWFSGLRGITDELTGIDLTTLTATDTVYLDCYEVLGDTPRPLLQAALTAGQDVVVNLGGSPPATWLKDATKAGRIGILQTNADEHDTTRRDNTLAQLTALDVADLVVVTAGRAGALASTRDSRQITAPAVPVDIHRVQGAGSAFSAALIHARLAGQDLDEALRFACRAGSHWCGRDPHGPLPTLDDLGRSDGGR